MQTILQTLLLTGSAVIAAYALTGCAGMEVGARAGIYRVDEREESQKTYHVKQARPLKCWFINCETPSQNGNLAAKGTREK